MPDPTHEVLNQPEPPAAVSRAFCESRLGGWKPGAPLGAAWGAVDGTLAAETDCDALIERALSRRPPLAAAATPSD